MRVWNVGSQQIKQLYNNKVVIIKSNEVIDLYDDLAVFLLSKREIRGQGLVQLKDSDSKEGRYKEGRKNIYSWAKEKWADYEKHCEERESQRLQPIKPHKEILPYKKTIDDYEEWVNNGEIVSEELVGAIGAGKVYVCPHCDMEFVSKEGMLSHLKVHTEEVLNAVNSGSTANKGAGEG